MQSLLINGSNQDLSLAELASLYNEDNFETVSNLAILTKLSPEDIDFNRLGGSIKLARIISITDYLNWDQVYNEILSFLTKKIEDDPLGNKLVFGISIYGLPKTPKDIMTLGFKVKKALTNIKKNIRFIPNQTNSLNAAQVINNKLTSKNNHELIVLIDNAKLYLANTVQVQNINEYSKRDFKRPYRDSKNGMLPPKLAQIIINLGAGSTKITDQTILDPFCGTGVILQEALLMGASVIGSDINETMIEYSSKNLNWLSDRFKLKDPNIKSFHQSDATTGKWSNFNFVTTETSLGPPLSYLPSNSELNHIINTSNQLIAGFLNNLAPQIAEGTRLSLAVPIWRISNGYKKLPLVDQINDLGYNFVEFNKLDSRDLVYMRNNQFVGRQLLILTRK